MSVDQSTSAPRLTQKQIRYGITLLLAFVIGFAWLTPIDSAAGRLTDDGLKRALVSFASARALNAVISVAQGTEISVEPAGIGVNFTPGQVLDPLNDLVEHFGDLMLTASIAFGVQKLLLAIGASWGISLLLSLAAALCIYLLWRKPEARAPLHRWSLRILAVLLVIRFALPLVTIGNEWLFQAFLKKDYQSSQAAVASWSGSAEDVAAAPAGNQSTMDSTMSNVRGWLSKNADIRQRIEKLRATAEETTEHVIKLMSIYLLQTLIIPLVFLWLLLKGVGIALTPGLRRIQ
jgi:hypothetical protein